MFMSLKLLKLRWKIFFWTITGRINTLHSRLELTLTSGYPESALIVFPMDEPSFRVACYSFRDLGKQDDKKRKFIFLVKEQFGDLFHLRVGDKILIQNSANNNTLSDEKLVLKALLILLMKDLNTHMLNQLKGGLQSICQN